MSFDEQLDQVEMTQAWLNRESGRALREMQGDWASREVARKKLRELYDRNKFNKRCLNKLLHENQ